MRQSALKTAKRTLGRAAGTAALLFLLLFSMTSFADPGDQTVNVERREADGAVTVGFSYGYENIAETGDLLPVTVHIANRGKEPVTGKLELLVPAPDGTEYRYLRKAEAAAGETLQVDEVISVPEGKSSVFIRFYGENGNILTETEHQIHAGGYGPELLIGVLSNNPESLSYLKDLSLDNTSLRTRTVSLTPADLAGQAGALDQLGAVVISGFQPERLSDEAVEALGHWVRGGGSLLVGTGLIDISGSALYSLFGEPEIGTASIREVNMGLEYSNQGPDGASIRLCVRDIFVPGAAQAMVAGDLTALSTLPLGSGTLGLMAFDLCTIGDFCSSHINYTEDLLKALIGRARLSRMTRLAAAEEERFRELGALTDIPDLSRMPSLYMYLIAALGYLLVAGPALYFYLKFRGLGLLYPLSVVFLSAFALLIFWFLGEGTRYEDRILHYARITEDGGSDRLFLMLTAPDSSERRLALTPDCTVLPLVAPAEDGMLFPSSVIEIERGEDVTELRVRGRQPFAKSFFEVYTGARQQEEVLFSDILCFGTEIDGSITNGGETSLRSAVLLGDGQAVLVGDIAAGEKRDLKGSRVLTVPLDEPGLVAAAVTGAETDAGPATGTAALAERRLLEYYISENLSGGFRGWKLLCFEDSQGLPELSAGSGRNTFGKSLRAFDVDVSRTKGRLISKVVRPEETRLISGEYSLLSNTTRLSAAVVLEYSLGSSLDIQSISFLDLSEEFEGAAAEGRRLGAFRGARAFYNYEEGSYELVDSDRGEWTGRELGPYLSPSNNMMVRYIPDDGVRGDGAMYLPVPVVTGTEKYAASRIG